MMTLLAQTTPAASELATWISVLMYIGGFVCTVLGGAVAVKKLREPAAKQVVVSSQPLVVSEHQEYVTRADLEKVDNQLHGRLKRERGEIDDRILSVERAAEARADKLEKKIDANTTITSATAATVNQMNLQLQQLNTHLLNQAKKSS